MEHVTAKPVIASADARRESRIVATPDTCGGRPRIEGTRISVARVAIWCERVGPSPDEIVSRWPHLRIGDVHAALAYYYDHRDEIDAQIRDDDDFAEALRAGQPSIFEKARRRDAQDDSVPAG